MTSDDCLINFYIAFHFSALCSVIRVQITSQRGMNMSDFIVIDHFIVLTTFWRHLSIFNFFALQAEIIVLYVPF